MFVKQKIRTYLAKKLGLPEIPSALERLTNIGFKPTLIFDVGAYQGDFANLCIKNFPNSKIACFEVLEHRVEQLKQIASQNPSLQVFTTLLGAEVQEKVQFNEAETASSVLIEQIQQDFPVNSYPMTTVDTIADKYFNGKSPDFLKLDVQGYELEVLKGAEKSLQGIQVVLAEVNLLDIHQNVPLLAEVISWLNERDWVAYDICGITRRPLDRALWQADFIFVPRHSPLRNDKRWGV
ncbi:FkbM family methyltransferase [Altericista sp. CCNU0014]|uniref:FkbM family methyltransferase n=1 Tax=Altericista sp. CCNU0014 TaxID=3082949 RepID=UPI00384C82A5